MKEETRRAIASTAAARINKKSISSIYSYDQKKHTPVSCDKDGDMYDYGSKAFVSKSGSDLFHYGTHAHINLSIDGDRFSGYDYDSKHHFVGNVNGSSIQIYDHGEHKYFNYSA